jgi:hypothetical protein
MDSIPAGLLPIAAVRERLTPQGGRPPHYKTVLRWIHDGIEAGGIRVHLGAAKVGGKLMIPEVALADFIAALSAGYGPKDEPSVSARDVRARSRRQYEAIEAMAKARGIP